MDEHLQEDGLCRHIRAPVKDVDRERLPLVVHLRFDHLR